MEMKELLVENEIKKVHGEDAQDENSNGDCEELVNPSIFLKKLELDSV